MINIIVSYRNSTPQPHITTHHSPLLLLPIPSLLTTITTTFTCNNKCAFNSTSTLPFEPQSKLLFPPMATVITPPPPLLFVRAATVSSRNTRAQSKRKQQKQHRAVGNFGHFADVVRKDMGFIKRGIDKGVAWANDAFRIPQLAKKVDDLVWLRNLEDPLAATSYSAPSWPQPWYPGGNTNKKCFFFACGVCEYVPNSS